ncbi:hypothetical protein AVEN_653-1 [Araneus ventricosus]|uniref:Uncharacterized protein n=1 Tax=Araneus ventricosus TaxID=182803 RepID=A0A4Y2BX27_ARAVE|nr:hypothetical protein AVEN_653-1 [Araneus ventricosus]
MTRMTPELAPPLSKLSHHTNGRTFDSYIRFSVRQAKYTMDLQWKRVSNLEPSAPEADALPLGHSHAEDNYIVLGEQAGRRRRFVNLYNNNEFSCCLTC